jgi:hypothetical protein
MRADQYSKASDRERIPFDKHTKNSIGWHQNFVVKIAAIETLG